MASLIKKLADAFTNKVEIDGFISNLDQLKADGTVNEEQYATMKEEYDQRLETTAATITQIQNELKQQREAKQREIETCEQEINKLEVKHKVGELPLEKYQALDRKLHSRVEKLGAEAARLDGIIATKSVDELRLIFRKSGAASPQLDSIARVSAYAKQLKFPPVKLPELSSLANLAAPLRNLKLPRFSIFGMIIGALLLISVFLPWISASATLGTQLGSDSGREVSTYIGRVGIFGGLFIMGIAFLPLPRLRRGLQTIVGLGALVALVYIVLPKEFYGAGTLPLLNEYARTLLVIREGLYLYGLVILALIFVGPRPASNG